MDIVVYGTVGFLKIKLISAAVGRAGALVDTFYHSSEVMCPISSLQREKKICHETYCDCSVKAKSVLVSGFLSVTCGTGAAILMLGWIGNNQRHLSGVKERVLACCDPYLLLDGHK